jgi:hypothetical protein
LRFSTKAITPLAGSRGCQPAIFFCFVSFDCSKEMIAFMEKQIPSLTGIP